LYTSLHQALASLPEVRVWLVRAAQQYRGRLTVAMEHLIAGEPSLQTTKHMVQLVKL